MRSFVYTAHRADGDEVIRAEVQAESESAAAKVLMGQGMFPISIEPKESAGFSRKLVLAVEYQPKIELSSPDSCRL